jgi:hypothetical protein
MALLEFAQQPLHVAHPKYRSGQQMPVKLRRNNARHRGRFLAASDWLRLTCGINIVLQASRKANRCLLNELKRPHAIMEVLLDTPEGHGQSAATSRTRSLITGPSASATGSQKGAISLRSNDWRRLGPEVSIRRLAGRERQPVGCRALARAYPSSEISIQTGDESERFYKENVRKFFWDKLPPQTLSSIGAVFPKSGCCSGRTSGCWSSESQGLCNCRPCGVAVGRFYAIRVC